MTQQEIKQNKFCVFLRIILRSSAITSLFFIWVGVANGAQFNLVSPVPEISIGQQFQLDLMLDTEGEIINAIEGEIIFPKELLELREIRDGDSIINLWVEKPSVNISGQLMFSGIIPTGFAGVLSPYYEGYGPGKIFSLIFISKNKGEGIVDFESGKVLLHDGLGTPADVKISNFQFLISEEVPSSEFQDLSFKDIDPPEPFKPEIVSDPNVFEGKYFLVFNAQDKGAGIYYYKVKEGDREFEIAESPYLLKNQGLYDEITVQAVDRAGNIREERLAAINEKPIYFKTELWIILIVIVLLLWLYKRKKLFSI